MLSKDLFSLTLVYFFNVFFFTPNIHWLYMNLNWHRTNIIEPVSEWQHENLCCPTNHWISVRECCGDPAPVEIEIKGKIL